MTDLLETLNEIQSMNPSIGIGKITRQRLRAEKRRMQKEKRSQMKREIMKNKILGGSSILHSWRNIEI
jgi:hypothetical protein